MVDPASIDCVAIKNAIQAQHLRERQGLTDEQVRRQIQERLATSDDVVARKWRRLGVREQSAGMVR
ncbi:MAG: hypothetical protein V2A79_00410 [Planctomycetota bacterium]